MTRIKIDMELDAIVKAEVLDKDGNVIEPEKEVQTDG